MNCCPTCEQVLPKDGMVIDLGANRVLHRGRIAKLTSQQASLLEVLRRGFPNSVSHEALLTGIHGPIKPDTAGMALRVILARLRPVIAPLGLRIVNHYGNGYSLCCDPMESEDAA